VETIEWAKGVRAAQLIVKLVGKRKTRLVVSAWEWRAETTSCQHSSSTSRQATKINEKKLTAVMGFKNSQPILGPTGAVIVVVFN
jgi:hypothetical protein